MMSLDSIGSCLQFILMPIVALAAIFIVLVIIQIINMCLDPQKYADARKEREERLIAQNARKLQIQQSKQIQQSNQSSVKHPKAVSTELRTVTPLPNINSMNGWQFEHYVARLLEHQGFKTRVTPGSGDWGVDVIAERGKVRYAVQVKRWSNAVGDSAVFEVDLGKGMYKCTDTIVITNSTFTASAIRLAESKHCWLVDGATLRTWMWSFHTSKASKGYNPDSYGHFTYDAKGRRTGYRGRIIVRSQRK